MSLTDCNTNTAEEHLKQLDACQDILARALLQAAEVVESLAEDNLNWTDVLSNAGKFVATIKEIDNTLKYIAESEAVLTSGKYLFILLT
ncbi:hypothetical protein GJ496_003517 [Pomphorhynchus laevis]|nr:hypothetical protein GJ496_003517 [Pomphorhynchus laevis]